MAVFLKKKGLVMLSPAISKIFYFLYCRNIFLIRNKNSYIEGINQIFDQGIKNNFPFRSK